MFPIMASSSCILQILIAAFSGYGVLSIFVTSLVLFISTIIFSFSRQKNEEEPVVVQEKEEEEQEEVLHQSSANGQQQCSPDSEKLSDEEDKMVKTEISCTISQEKAVQADQIHRDLYSESESIDYQSSSSDQDSDADWLYSGNLLGQSPDCSDDSISDEESLIEIALPSGHYVGSPKEDPKFSLQQKFQDFGSIETKVFHQHSIKQLFAEVIDMNEEENLIEIDLSMGSIKCPRFEIEA